MGFFSSSVHHKASGHLTYKDAVAANARMNNLMHTTGVDYYGANKAKLVVKTKRLAHPTYYYGTFHHQQHEDNFQKFKNIFKDGLTHTRPMTYAIVGIGAVLLISFLT